MSDDQLLHDVRSLRWLMEEVRWDEQRPRSAPQFRCHECRRWIARKRTVMLLAADSPGAEPVLLCLTCMDRPSPRAAHAKWYPGCPERWHDMYDHHEHAWCSRAGVASLLGIWPARRESEQRTSA